MFFQRKYIESEEFKKLRKEIEFIHTDLIKLLTKINSNEIKSDSLETQIKGIRQRINSKIFKDSEKEEQQEDINNKFSPFL